MSVPHQLQPRRGPRGRRRAKPVREKGSCATLFDDARRDNDVREHEVGVICVDDHAMIACDARDGTTRARARGDTRTMSTRWMDGWMGRRARRREDADGRGVDRCGRRAVSMGGANDAWDFICVASFDCARWGLTWCARASRVYSLTARRLARRLRLPRSRRNANTLRTVRV